jgi:diphthamide synthase (EF-2-diphthine--ammonia ligase)
MIDVGKINAIIVKVATLGLDESHLGQSLAEIRPHLQKMVSSFFSRQFYGLIPLFVER